MKTTKKLKTITLSLGLAALMFQAVTVDAQVINRGLLQNPYKDNSNKNHGMMNQQGDRRGGMGIDVNTQDFGQAPLGSGIAILIGAGLGYVALKKKEDER